MINRAGNKEKAKRVLNENGNLSGMVGMEILYRVIAAITSVLLGAMIAGGIGVVSAVVSAPFKLFGLAGIIIAYVLITPIATLVGAIAGGAVAGPFEVARYRYYLSLRKNGIRPKVTCIFDAFDFFMQFALVTGVRMLTIMWIPVLIQFATLLLAAVVAAASRSYLAAMLLVMIGMIAALVVAAYRSYQFWPMALVQADHPQLNAEQVMERCKRWPRKQRTAQQARSWKKADSPAKRPASLIRWLRRLSEKALAAREADREPNRLGQ